MTLSTSQTISSKMSTPDNKSSTKRRLSKTQSPMNASLSSPKREVLKRKEMHPTTPETTPSAKRRRSKLQSPVIQEALPADEVNTSKIVTPERLVSKNKRRNSQALSPSQVSSDILLSSKSVKKSKTGSTPEVKKKRNLSSAPIPVDMDESIKPSKKSLLKDSVKNSFDHPETHKKLLAEIRKRLVEQESRTVLVRKLPKHTSVPNLTKLCPEAVAIRMPAKSSCNRNLHAFIEFASPEQAEAFAKETDGKHLSSSVAGGRPLQTRVCLTLLQSGQHPSWASLEQRNLTQFAPLKLHVACVPVKSTEAELYELFGGEGLVKALKVQYTAKRESIVNCSVVYGNQADALNAFNTLHGAILHKVPLMVNFHAKSSHTFEDKQATRKSSTTTNTPTPGSPPKSTKQQGFKKKRLVKKPQLRR